MATLLEVNVHRFPLNGSRIHKQGQSEFIAVGPQEVSRLRRRQSRAVDALQARFPLVGFLDLSDGSLFFTDGSSFAVAKVDRNGKTRRFVEWL